jgi:UDP-glucose 4-epimerase
LREKILVTGGKGFLGAKLVEKLSQNHDVDSFDIVDGYELRNLNDVRINVAGKASVFHLAAVADLNRSRVNPRETFKVNLEGTWNIAQACKEYGAKLYFASTCCVYGNQKAHPVTEESLPNPAEIYACSKLAGESIVKGFHYTYGLQYNMMRFATIYGPGTRPALATHIFMGQALRGEPITVHGDGTQTRTLTYIDDLIDSIVALHDSGKMNDVWNLTTEEEVSALQMARDI